jgi:hypothetical protein
MQLVGFADYITGSHNDPNNGYTTHANLWSDAAGTRPQSHWPPTKPSHKDGCTTQAHPLYSTNAHTHMHTHVRTETEMETETGTETETETETGTETETEKECHFVRGTISGIWCICVYVLNGRMYICLDTCLEQM